MEEQERPINELAKGLNQFLKQVEQPVLDASNPYFKSNYLTLTGLQKTISKALDGTGLSYVQLVATTSSGAPGVRTLIMHESGQMMDSGVLTLKPTKNDPQGMGSAITYAKRYQLAAMFGIAGEKDDDGNGASYPNRQAHRSAPQQRQNRPQGSRQGNQPNNRANGQGGAPNPKIEQMKKAYHGKRAAVANETDLPIPDAHQMIGQRAKKNIPANASEEDKWSAMLAAADAILAETGHTEQGDLLEEA